MDMYMPISRETHNLIDREYLQAQMQHNGYTPGNPDMTDNERLNILTASLSEAITADDLRDPLLHVAAMAAAWLDLLSTRTDSAA